MHPININTQVCQLLKEEIYHLFWRGGEAKVMLLENWDSLELRWFLRGLFLDCNTFARKT
jgi:hypothetical protein